MALLAPRELLFLDEPTNSMDPTSRQKLYKHLRSLKETAILLITHRIDEAEKICDKIAIFKDGIIVEGPCSTDQLRDKHGSTYIIVVSMSQARVDEAKNRIEGLLDFCELSS